MGELAKVGRDKLTLILSPGINRFGAWGEQLIAESLGKEGVGVLPVDGEVVLTPESYLQDRFFVYLQMEGENELDGAVTALAEAGHPVVHLVLDSEYALAEHYFMWEIATIIAAHKNPAAALIHFMISSLNVHLCTVRLRVLHISC